MLPFIDTKTSGSAVSSERLLLWLVAVGFFMQTLDSTIVNTSLPMIARSLGESPLRMQSVVIAYSLAMALLIPASGWLADRFGTRKMFFAAMLVFSLGSLFCALAPRTNLLVAARVVQGMGGAMLMPIGRLAVLRAFPQEKFLGAMNFVTIPALIGPLIGPTLGGWFSQVASWHWIFLINIPIGIVGCICTLLYMPDFRGVERHRFDWSGYILLSLSMVAISIAVDGLAELGLQRAAVLILLVFGLASLIAYWLQASRKPHPLFPLGLFSIETFRVGLLGNLFARMGSGSMPLLIPLLLQLSLGYSPLEAGLMMLPVAIAGLAAKRLIVPIIVRFGYRTVLVGNTILVGLSMASFIFVSENQSLWMRVVQLLIYGTVNSWQFTAMNTVTLQDLDPQLASSGNSLLSMVTMLSMGLGAAAAGALLNSFSEVFGGHGSGGATLQAFRASFVAVGFLTSASAWIFWQLSAHPCKIQSRTQGLELHE